MQRYLIFDENAKMLAGFLEVPLSDEGENLDHVNGLKILVDEFPAITEGTTPQLNADGTWGVVDIIPVV